MVKVIINSERVNCYGTRIISNGILLEEYRKNPVLLYMHFRGEVIGKVENLAIEGGNLVGELVFDEVSELSQRVAKQFEKGSLNAVSGSFRIIEMSDDPKLLVQGQTSPTVTRCYLKEVSVVDIPGNPDAVRLFDESGAALELSDNGSSPLPRLNNIQTHTNFMEQKALALSLGLPEDATMEQIQAKIAELKASSTELKTVKDEKEQMVLAAITAAVDTAIAERRLSADKKDQFVQLGQKVGLEDLKSTLAAMQPAAKISGLIQGEGKKWTKLSDVPSDQIAELKENDPSTYARLYEAEYGMKL